MGLKATLGQGRKPSQGAVDKSPTITTTERSHSINNVTRTRNQEGKSISVAENDTTPESNYKFKTKYLASKSPALTKAVPSQGVDTPGNAYSQFAYTVGSDNLSHNLKINPLPSPLKQNSVGNMPPTSHMSNHPYSFQHSAANFKIQDAD